MAKLRKSEREALELAEKMTRYEELKETWLMQVLKVLHRADRAGSEIRVNETSFHVKLYQDGLILQFDFPFELAEIDANWTTDEYELSRLETELDYMDAAQAEEIRKQELKKAALDKLTDEEKQVLGL